MNQQKSHYQSLLDKLSDWVLQSARQDMLSLYEVVEQAKAYLHAAEDLSLEEIRNIEIYLLRDIRSFITELQQQADQSIWWRNTRHQLWQLMAKMADPGKLALFEMEQDVAHQGVYRSGEWVAIGDLVCSHCGHRHQVKGVEQIQPCIKCSHQRFSRTTDRSR